MEIGKYTYGIEHIKLKWENCANLKIGNFCSIADNIQIYLGGNHMSNWISTYPFGIIHKNIFNKIKENEGYINNLPKTNGDVIIGNDVWIGANVTIMSGVKIGDGAIIAANSHVLEKVKPYSVVGGNPAIFYYFRFNKDVIEKLLELKWWNFDDEKINEISPILCSGDYQKLFDFCKTNYNL